MISEKVSYNLRTDLYKSLLRKDVEFYDERKSGDLCK